MGNPNGHIHGTIEKEFGIRYVTWLDILTCMGPCNGGDGVQSSRMGYIRTNLREPWQPPFRGTYDMMHPHKTLRFTP